LSRNKKKTKQEEIVSSKENPKSPTQQYEELEEKYRDKLPKNWDQLSHHQRLDWFGHRMILEIREQIRQEKGNQAARDSGIMSDYQLERRRRREVQSKLGGWDDIPPHKGIFGRKYVDPNVLWTGLNKQEGTDG